MIPPTPPPSNRGAWLLPALVAALPGTLIGLAVNPDRASGGLLNPDSAMRLARLQDILQAGHPLEAVLRDNSGAGAVLHWSHLLDSLLLLAAAPAAALLGWHGALHLVGLLAGPLSLAGLGVALAWAARPYAPRGWAWAAAAVAGCCPGVAGYGMTGVVHHHVLLALAAVMACGWALRLLQGSEPVAGGLALGGWAGAALWLSPESLPFSLMAMGALWLAWVVAPGRQTGVALAACGAGFAVLVGLAWLVDPPAAGLWAVQPDRISLPFALLAAATAAAGLLARTGRRLPALGCGIGSAAAWLLLFPQMLHGSEALLPPEVVAAMFDRIQEMQPVRTPRDAAETLLGGLFAVAVLLVLAFKRRGPLPVYALACAVGLVGLAALHVRFSTYTGVAGAALLPLAIGWAEAARIAPRLQSLARLGLVLPLLLGPVLVPAAASALPGGETPAAGTTCRVSGAVALLAPFPDQVVLSDVNVTPELLYRTRVRTVGSLFHRTPQGFMRLRAAWRSIPEDEADVPPALLDTGATLVLACPGAARSALLDGLPHTTLADRLAAGLPPAWLRRVADAGPGGFVLYAVAP